MLYVPEPAVPVTAANDPQVAAVQATPFNVKLVTRGMSPGRSFATVIWNGLGAAPAWMAGGVILGTTICTVGGSAAKPIAPPVTERMAIREKRARTRTRGCVCIRILLWNW